MINFFKIIKPLDITLIQTDWKGPEFTHTWLATYYGEPIGLIHFSENTWKIYGQVYKEEKVLLFKKHEDVKYRFGADDLLFDEIKRLRKAKRIYSRFLNKKHYKVYRTKKIK